VGQRCWPWRRNWRRRCGKKCNVANEDVCKARIEADMGRRQRRVKKKKPIQDKWIGQTRSNHKSHVVLCLGLWWGGTSKRNMATLAFSLRCLLHCYYYQHPKTRAFSPRMYALDISVPVQQQRQPQFFIRPIRARIPSNAHSSFLPIYHTDHQPQHHHHHYQEEAWRTASPLAAVGLPRGRPRKRKKHG